MAQVDVKSGLALLGELLDAQVRAGLLLTVATMETRSRRWFYAGRGYVADEAISPRPPVECKIRGGIVLSLLPEELTIKLRELWIPGQEIKERLASIASGGEGFEFSAQNVDCSDRRYSWMPGKLTAWPEQTFVLNGPTASVPTPTLQAFVYKEEDQSSPQVFVRDWLWKQVLPCRNVIVDGAAIGFGGMLAIVVPDTRARLNTPVWQGSCVAVSAVASDALPLAQLRVRATFSDSKGVESPVPLEAADAVANKFKESADAQRVAVRLLTDTEIIDEFQMQKEHPVADVPFEDALAQEWGEEDADNGEVTFRRVVSGVHFCGRNFLERSPAFAQLDEEGLRDVVTASISIAFPNTTAESFSKKGKTDILVRSQGHTTFIAECKIWGGTAVYCGAISQLLDRYLTWRDHRNGCVILFNKANKDFQRVLQTIEQDTPTHGYFARAGKIDRKNGVFEYFLKSKEGDDVRLLVLAFNLHRD